MLLLKLPPSPSSGPSLLACLGIFLFRIIIISRQVWEPPDLGRIPRVAEGHVPEVSEKLAKELFVGQGWWLRVERGGSQAEVLWAWVCGPDMNSFLDFLARGLEALGFHRGRGDSLVGGSRLKSGAGGGSFGALHLL